MGRDQLRVGTVPLAWGWQSVLRIWPRAGIVYTDVKLISVFFPPFGILHMAGVRHMNERPLRNRGWTRDALPGQYHVGHRPFSEGQRLA